jgi:hypothetical protein
MKQAVTWFFGFIFFLSGMVFAQDNPPADVTITIDHKGASAYFIASVEGADSVAEVNADNAAWSLVAGKRYHIINKASAGHPFQLRGADDGILLSQKSGEDGSLKTAAEVNFVSDDQGITFTLSPILAEAVKSYRCAIHARMTGAITVTK